MNQLTINSEDDSDTNNNNYIENSNIRGSGSYSSESSTPSGSPLSKVHSYSIPSNPLKGTLLEILQDPILHSPFMEYLKQERCEENITFWTEVNDYRQQANELSLAERQEKAQQIYSKFLARDLINISDRTKKKLVKALRPNNNNNNNEVNNNSNGNPLMNSSGSESGVDDIGANLFDQAQKEIYELLSLDIKNRFLISDQFKSVELERFKQRITDPIVGLQCTPKKGKLKDYPNTFLGGEAVEWALVQGGPGVITREQAIQLLQQCMDDRKFTIVDLQETIFSESSLYSFGQLPLNIPNNNNNTTSTLSSPSPSPSSSPLVSKKVPLNKSPSAESTNLRNGKKFLNRLSKSNNDIADVYSPQPEHVNQDKLRKMLGEESINVLKHSTSSNSSNTSMRNSSSSDDL